METASYSLDAIDRGPRYLLKQILELHSTLNDFWFSRQCLLVHNTYLQHCAELGPDGTPAPWGRDTSSKIPGFFYYFHQCHLWKALSSYPQQPAELCCRRIMLSTGYWQPRLLCTMRQSSLISVNITFAVPCFASNHILVSLLFKQFRTTFQ